MAIDQEQSLGIGSLDLVARMLGLRPQSLTIIYDADDRWHVLA